MSKFKVTSDFVVNALCTVTIGAGTIEYCSNIIFNGYHVKYLKEANKYVTEKYSYLSIFIYQFLSVSVSRNLVDQIGLTLSRTGIMNHVNYMIQTSQCGFFIPVEPSKFLVCHQLYKMDLKKYNGCFCRFCTNTINVLLTNLKSKPK